MNSRNAFIRQENIKRAASGISRVSLNTKSKYNYLWSGMWSPDILGAKLSENTGKISS